MYFLSTTFLLRVGVVFAFVYPVVSALINPYSWIGYFPPFLADITGPHIIVLLHAFGVLELTIALWILLGRHILIPSSIAAGMLSFIIFFNTHQMDVIFRDVSILLMVIVLIFDECTAARLTRKNERGTVIKRQLFSRP